MLLVRRGRERIHVGPGEDVRIPAKVRHTFEAEVDSTYTAEFRPALRVGEFFRDLFALPTDKRGNPPDRRCCPPEARLPGRVPLLPLHSGVSPADPGSVALQTRNRFSVAQPGSASKPLLDRALKRAPAWLMRLIDSRGT